jgi:hypothetical protein
MAANFPQLFSLFSNAGRTALTATQNYYHTKPTELAVVACRLQLVAHVNVC